MHVHVSVVFNPSGFNLFWKYLAQHQNKVHMIDITCINISFKLPGLLVDLETYLIPHQKGQGHAFHFELYQSIHCKSKIKKRMVQIQNSKPTSSHK